MNREIAEKIADAVLYEGYMLYPYRPSAIKNRQRWTFGTLYPPGYAEVTRGTESSSMHSEFLVSTLDECGVALHLRLRFLHLAPRQLWNADGEEVASLKVDGQVVEAWDEPCMRALDLDLHGLSRQTITREFGFSSHQAEPVSNPQSPSAGTITRTQFEVNGSISCSAEKIWDNLFKVAMEVRNTSPLTTDPEDRAQALLRSMLSAHLVLTVEGGEFVSLLDPPTEFRCAVESCKNSGNFPVLVGEPGEHNILLCSPILLYDYPQIAPESAGNFFDGTEIDEMLTLRIMTLTDQEKQEMRFADDRVRDLLERTEQTAREQLTKTHGTFRNLRPASGE